MLKYKVTELLDFLLLEHVSSVADKAASDLTDRCVPGIYVGSLR